jgi:hypothetical protein
MRDERQTTHNFSLTAINIGFCIPVLDETLKGRKHSDIYVFLLLFLKNSIGLFQKDALGLVFAVKLSLWQKVSVNRLAYQKTIENYI